MSWLIHYNVTVPCYRVIDGKVVFAIKLKRNEVSAQVAASSPYNEVCTTLRSYSQFRRLRTTLQKQLNKLEGIKRRCHSRILNLAHSCRCADIRCEFDALNPILQSFPFPFRRSLRSKLTGLDHVAVNERRNGLAAFVALLHDFFTTFQGGILRGKLQSGGCLVLETYMSFLGITEHFPIDTSIVLHRPLALNGWRQQCFEQMLCQDNIEDEGLSYGKCVYDLAFITQSRTKEGFTRTFGEKGKIRHLPSLQIKPGRVHSMYSFMEEFCEHALSQFASDMDELKSPDLTQARRWEICLYVACRIGHFYAVQLILLNYADANSTIADGSSCLHIAARMGRTDIVGILLDDGANVNKANDVGVTPLIAACRNGSAKVVNRLLDAGALVSVCSNRGTYPLHAAIVSQNIKIVSILVERGANVNVTTISGITPLHFAAKLGSLAISEYLLCHNANAEKRTKNDNDAMMIADAYGHATIYELLQRFSGVSNNEHVPSIDVLLDDTKKAIHLRSRRYRIACPAC